MRTILVVEDEHDASDLIAFNLERAGFKAIRAFDGIAGTESALRDRPDLIILDVMLPGRDGYALLKELRRDARTNLIPVIMLTARAQTEDRIQGLGAGADDYVVKPFSPKELILRVQSVLKRTDRPAGTALFSHGPFRFDKNMMKFYIEGEPVDLTATEFRLMLHICERAGATQDRNDLMRTVWGYSDEVNSRTLDTHMKRLRQKLGPHGTLVETVRGIGYRVSSLSE